MNISEPKKAKRLALKAGKMLSEPNWRCTQKTNRLRKGYRHQGWGKRLGGETAVFGQKEGYCVTEFLGNSAVDVWS